MSKLFTEATVVTQGGHYGTPLSYLIQLRYVDTEGNVSAKGVYGVRSKAKAEAIAEFLTEALKSETVMADIAYAHTTILERNQVMRRSLGLVE